ncbi:MAG: hypothetical protein JZU58_03600 [Curvibacter lanceolatus]|nr:hypothetical protein [Curvibacter lanceolatus]
MKSALDSLSGKSAQLTVIISVLTSIAFPTNILAIDAAIEAAHT